jgi:hypothetical protein
MDLPQGENQQQDTLCYDIKRPCGVEVQDAAIYPFHVLF